MTNSDNGLSTRHDGIAGRVDTATLSRVIPFAAFMFFIGIEELWRVLAGHGWVGLSDVALYYLYPLKAAVAGGLLLKYASQYDEIRINDLGEGMTSAVVCGLGILTCALWVWMDWMVTVTGPPKGFNPALLPKGAVRIVLTATRIVGAVLVVPVMEEIFWRSFLLRYLRNADFLSVKIGQFTWTSFIVTTILFGLEHHLIIAGMVAGAIFNLILYKTRSIAQCILAHAITNLTLAGYVLFTGRWDFW